MPDAQPTSEVLSTSGKGQSLDDSFSANLNLASSTGTHEASVLEISPLPKRKYTINSKRRKSSKATVLTSSPHKRSIKVSERRTTAKKCKKALQPKAKSKPVNAENRVYNCIVCGESTNEDWIQCCRCLKWAHEECGNITDP